MECLLQGACVVGQAPDAIGVCRSSLICRRNPRANATIALDGIFATKVLLQECRGEVGDVVTFAKDLVAGM